MRSERLSRPRIHSQSVAEQDPNQSSSYPVQRNGYPGRDALLCWGLREARAGRRAGPTGHEPLPLPATTDQAAKPRPPGDSQRKPSQEWQVQPQPSWEINDGSTHTQLQNPPNFNAMALRGQLRAVVGARCYRYLCLQSWGPQAPSDQAVRNRRTSTQCSWGWAPLPRHRASVGGLDNRGGSPGAGASLAPRVGPCQAQAWLDLEPARSS